MPLPNSLDLDSLGGVKQDFSPVVDPTYDLSADDHNSGFAALAEMSRTAPRAIAKCTLGASPSTSLDVGNWDSSYAMHVAHSSTGVFTLTYPAAVLDALGNTISINFRNCLYSLNWEPFGTPTLITGSVTSANVVTIKTWTTAGVAVDPTGAILNVAVF